MSIARALAILGAGASGFQGGQEQARQRAQQEEDAAFRREQRDRTRTDWQRKDKEYEEQQADKAAERAAMAPVPVTEAELPGPVMEGQAPMPTVSKVAGTAYATPQEAQAAAGKMNATGERMRRAAGAVQDPMRAADLEGRANQAETGNLQLQAAREAAASAAFDKELVGSVQKGGWQGLAEFMSKSKADGMGGQSKFAVKVEGGNATLYPVGPDGTAMGQGMTLPDTEEGRARAAFLLSQKTTPQQKLEHFRVERNDKQAEENRQRDDRRADTAEQRRATHEDRMYEQARRQTAASERAASARASGGGGANGQQAAVNWDDKADERLYSHYGTEDPTTGAKSRDGQGIDFAKQVALAISARNGGDTLRAVGMAIDIDSQLKARADAAVKASGGKLTPADAIRQERNNFLSAKQPQVVPGTTPAPAAPAAAPAAAVPQPRMGAAAKAATPQEANLDAAKQAFARAQADLQKFGSRQRQADPEGFARAQQAATAAEAAVKAAADEYEKSLSGSYNIPRMLPQA